MKKLTLFSLFLVLAVTTWSCSDDSSSTGPNPEGEQASSQKQFVWEAMNYWYFWQGDVPELADNHAYFDSDQAFQEYLMGFSDAKSLFNELVYEQEDDFSFFIEDYEEYEQEQDGIFAALGFEYGLIPIGDTNNLVGYVQYIISDSPADEVGLERGDLFTKVNETQITRDNFRDLLTGEDSYELTLAKLEGNTISETGETVTVQSERVQRPAIFASTVIDTHSTKIGYLVYNAFRGNSHRELNQVFGDFKAAGIDELILDLRYNGGGAVLTSRLLASMISGQSSSSIFAEFMFNDKRSTNNESVTFLDRVPIANEDGDFTDEEGNFFNTITMNQLSLGRLYVLTGFGTASASEALINGLEAYIDVVVIGGQTVGKDEGSITLYDAPPPYTSKEEANSNHKKAIQPIVLKITNKNGSGYPNGLQPDLQVDELNFINELPPLGSTSDPLVTRAISRITGEAAAKSTTHIQRGMPFGKPILIDSRGLRHSKGMYIEPFMVPSPNEH